jgi:hypothetical protein
MQLSPQALPVVQILQQANPGAAMAAPLRQGFRDDGPRISVIAAAKIENRFMASPLRKS